MKKEIIGKNNEGRRRRTFVGAWEQQGLATVKNVHDLRNHRWIPKETTLLAPSQVTPTVKEQQCLLRHHQRRSELEKGTMTERL